MKDIRIPQLQSVRFFIVPDPGTSYENLPSSKESLSSVGAETGGKQHSTCGTKEANFV